MNKIQTLLCWSPYILTPIFEWLTKQGQRAQTGVEVRGRNIHYQDLDQR